MPYVYVDKQDYDLIPRLTEIVGVLDCEAKGAFHPVHTGSNTWTEMSTYVALKGTLLHHKIENHCRELIDMQPTPLELSVGDRQLYDEVMNDPDAMAWVSEQIEIGWNNFKKFEFDFKPTILVPEQTMVYIHRENGKIIHKKSVKGTVDLICELDPDIMTEKALKMFPIGDKCTVMLDWKSGSSKQIGHHAQLEGYHWMLQKTGKFDEYVDSGLVKNAFAHITNETGRTYPTALCVLLGGKYYKAIPYDLTEGLWDQAREIFLDPQPIAFSRNKWSNNVFREGYYCVFCTYRDNVCPIFYTRENTVELEVVNR
jgi:hypothetical protein